MSLFNTQTIAIAVSALFVALVCIHCYSMRTVNARVTRSNDDLMFDESEND